jgi:hypothetical protein
MISPLPGSLILGGLLIILVLLRDWPRLLCGVALAGCALPFFISTSAPLVRSVMAVFTTISLIKALQFAAGHVRPQGRVDFMLYMLTLGPLVRWETPLRPDPRGALRTFGTAALQLGLASLLVLAVMQLDSSNPVQLVTSQIGLYLVVAGLCNLNAVKLSLRGLDRDDVFDNPLASRSPAEFWGRRWNTYVRDLLHRYVFLPVGGRRHPLRGILTVFAVSGIYHELVFDLGTLKFNGGMLGFFMLQGGLVAGTTQSRSVRRFVREAPVLAWCLTTILMLGTGILFVRGMAAVDPSDAWYRVFPPAAITLEK